MLPDDAPIAALNLPFLADPDAPNADLVGCSYRRPTDQRRVIVVSNKPEKASGDDQAPDSLICALPGSPDCTWDHLVGASQARYFRTLQVDEVRQAARESLLDTSIDPSEVPDPVSEGKEAALRFLPSRKDDLGLGKRWTLPSPTKEEVDRRAKRLKKKMDAARSSSFFDSHVAERTAPKSSAQERPAQERPAQERPPEGSPPQKSPPQESPPQESPPQKGSPSFSEEQQAGVEAAKRDSKEGGKAKTSPKEKLPTQSSQSDSHGRKTDRATSQDETPTDPEKGGTPNQQGEKESDSRNETRSEKEQNGPARDAPEQEETDKEVSGQAKQEAAEGTVAAHGSLADEFAEEENENEQPKETQAPDPNQRSLF